MSIQQKEKSIKLFSIKLVDKERTRRGRLKYVGKSKLTRRLNKDGIKDGFGK